jgi:hypothetical protein
MTLNIASRRDIILLFLQYGIYDSSNPSTFIRSLPTGQAPIPLPSREIVRSHKLEECLTVVLKSEIGHGATDEVLRGTLEVEASEGCVLLDVAVKLALSSEQCAALRNEYAAYQQLRLKAVTSGITAPLGLFYDVDPEGGPSALVMPYAGVPLHEMPELILPYSHRCVTIVYYYYPHFLTCSGQGGHSYSFGENTSRRCTARRSSSGQHHCG